MDWTEHQIGNLINEHHPAVRAVLGRLDVERSDLLDMEQETFLRALLSLNDLRDESLFKPWIQSIARNVALNRFRSGQRARRRDEEWYRASITSEAVVQEAAAGLVELALRRIPKESEKK